MAVVYDIVGCGAAIQRLHVLALRPLVAAGKIRVGTCYDVNPVAAKRVARLLRADRAANPSEMRDLGDAAIIATPPEHHADFASRYLESRRHVLIEKPFVTRGSDARRLTNSANQHDARLLVGHLRRYSAGVAAARRFIATGALGDVWRIDASEGARFSWPGESNYTTSNRWGGVILDTGSHVLDIVLYVLGWDSAPVHIEDTVITKLPAYEPSHKCNARFSLVNGKGGRLEVSVQLSRLEPRASALKIFGSLGCLVVPSWIPRRATLHTHQNVLQVEAADGQSVPLQMYGCLAMEHADFHAAVAGSSQESRLDAGNFIVLADILEALTEAGQ